MMLQNFANSKEYVDKSKTKIKKCIKNIYYTL